MLIHNRTVRHLPAAISVAALISAVALVASAAPAAADDGTGKDPSPGVSLNQADRAALAGESAVLKANQFAAAHGALGVYRDGASRLAIRVPASGAGSTLTGRDLSAERLGNVRLAKSRYTHAKVDAITDKIEGRAWHADAMRYAYAFHYKASDDAVVVATNAPADVTQPLRAAGVVVVQNANIGRGSRQSDTPPFWGGASITNGGGICTSGFAVQNSSGTRYMVTAGHCFSYGDEVHSTGNGRSLGTVTNRAPFPTWDLEMIGGGSYGAYIYTGGATGTATHMIGAGNPVVGYTGYCYSGQTSYENCGETVTSLNGEFCDASGCTPGLAVFSGGAVVQPGDSGSPMYLPGSSGAYMRGIIIAYAGSDNYAEKWSTVANYWGVSIVT